MPIILFLYIWDLYLSYTKFVEVAIVLPTPLKYSAHTGGGIFVYYSPFETYAFGTLNLDEFIHVRVFIG